ncbi:MAG TPA: hypothetical protein VMT44_08495 [Methanoregula sp.]|nr:hypothetical protein [Methanoregula sp.]
MRIRQFFPEARDPFTGVYRFTAPETPGTYYFRCDVQPSVMNGEFIVR